MIPLGKRGKNPQECGDERPIALIDASAKILKAIVLNRIQSGLEPQLTPAQYAFRRARGTEMQLIEIYDFGQAGNRGDLVAATSPGFGKGRGFWRAARAHIMFTNELFE